MSLILLAGGKSTRINTDKAFLKLIEDKTIIENIIDCLKHVFSEIIIVANNVKDYKFLGFKVVPDLIRNKGPLGGLYTGLKTAKDDFNFVLACDMPFINKDLVRYMLKFNDFDVVVPRVNGYTEPLHAAYSKKILSVIKNQFKNNELKMSETIKKIKKVRYIEKEEIKKLGNKDTCFFNINDKDDFEKAKKIIENEEKI